MLARLCRCLYGELPPDKLLQALTFSLLLCFVVGIYWLMRSLKDSVFATIVGLEHQPQAKMLSLLVCMGVLFIYNKVVDLVSRHHLFAIVCGTYAVIFVGIAACLLSTTIGLHGPDGKALPASADRWLGWVHYFAIESYGSLAVSLFWQYTNSQVNLADAKAAYGIITAGGQIGAITGCSLVVGSRRFGVPQLYGLGGLLTLVAPVIVHYYHQRFGSGGSGGRRIAGGDTPDTAALVENGGECSGNGSHSTSEMASSKDPDSSSSSKATAPTSDGKDSGSSSKDVVAPGLFEGLRLLIHHPYVLGIFAVSALFEIIATILDYQMKVLGKANHDSTADFAAFMGFFGQAANSVSLVFSLLGTSFVIRNLGLRLTLMLFPCTLIIAVHIVWTAPSMWVLFAVMVSIKGLAYALNNPSKEMLYMATTDSIKFKVSASHKAISTFSFSLALPLSHPFACCLCLRTQTKSWIDVFGGRASKAVGSLVTNTFKKPVENLMFYGSIVSLSIACALLMIAAMLGSTFERLSASGKVIGMEGQDENEESEMKSLTDQEVRSDDGDDNDRRPLKEAAK